MMGKMIMSTRKLLLERCRICHTSEHVHYYQPDMFKEDVDWNEKCTVGGLSFPYHLLSQSEIDFQWDSEQLSYAGRIWTHDLQSERSEKQNRGNGDQIFLYVSMHVRAGLPQTALQVAKDLYGDNKTLNSFTMVWKWSQELCSIAFWVWSR